MVQHFSPKRYPLQSNFMTIKIVTCIPEVLDELKSRLGQGVSPIVAIDGRGGAGKSSLARSIVASIPDSAHIEFDWFHLPKDQITSERRYDYARLVNQLIEPFNNGARSFKIPRYNWGFLAGIRDGFHNDPAIIGSAKTLVIEGCGLLYKELVSHFGIRIWVDTDAEQSFRRGIQRDIDEYKLDPEKVYECWTEWVAREERSLRLDDRRERADLFLKSAD
jgi:uridine kinase